MEFLERILLLIYFPQFRSPNNSRFESLFQTLKEKDIHFKKILYKSKNICPEKIARNEDKRTSIIIEGLPSDIYKSDVRNMVEKFGNINFLYIIKDIKNGKKITNAYINFINYKSIIPLFMSLRNLQIERKGKIFSIKIIYSSPQGKENIKEYLKRNNFYKQ